MKKLYYLAACILAPMAIHAQISFTDGTNSLNSSTLKSGVAMAINDMNNDGLDDVVRLSNGSSLEIEFQQADGSFQLLSIGNVGEPWGMTIADVDKNGFNDVIVGGFYDELKLVSANADGTAYSISSLDGPDIFLQNANFADIDNDGNIDFFGCHDDGISSIYKNNGAGGLNHDVNLLNPESTIPSDNSGNYGSIWTDYDNDGDLDLYISKCRQGASNPMDGRRLNLLFQNDGNNNFTDVAEAAGLRPQTQTWSSNFEDIDNDGDMDVVMINHFTNHQIFENNGDGTFSDITATSGIVSDLSDVGFGIQVAMEDFDNDTYIDIIMTTLDGNHHIFLNNGDKTFTTLTTGLSTDATMQSTALGDLNNDGFIDILAGYATGFNNPSNTSDQLFLNEGNDNNYMKLNLQGTNSNINAIGAKVTITGDFGTQVREVRAGESYGTQNALTSHFGLGTFASITSIVVNWPSGLTETITNPPINKTNTLIEGQGVLGISNQNTISFTIYPNPAGDIVTIQIPETTTSNSVEIHSIAGKKIMTQDIYNGTNTINIASLPTGVYFVTIGNTTEKLLVR